MTEVLQLVRRYVWVFLFGCGISSLVLAGSPSEQTFDLRIAHGSVAKEMQVLRVKQGDLVKLRWTTDEPMTLHLHGYNIEKDAKPGAVTEFAFKAYATGRYPITVHGPENHFTLVYVEVYPR